MTARDAQSGTRTVRLSGGAPRPVTSTLHSAPIRTAVTRPTAVPLPGFEASLPLSVSGATSACTVALTPESGGAITSSSYTPGTRSSARTTNPPVPGSVRPSCTSSTSRNGCPFGSYSRAVALLGRVRERDAREQGRPRRGGAEEVALHAPRADPPPLVVQRPRRQVVRNDDGVGQGEQRAGERIARIPGRDGPDVHAGRR